MRNNAFHHDKKCGTESEKELSALKSAPRFRGIMLFHDKKCGTESEKELSALKSAPRFRGIMLFHAKNVRLRVKTPALYAQVRAALPAKR
jgi:hypothetical protein